MKDRTLQLIFAVSLVAAILFPLVSILYIYPSFTKLMVSNTENEALRTGAHFARTYFSDSKALTDKSIDDKFIQATDDLMHDYGLMKIKVFAASGETLFSSDKGDIGQINKKPYFHDTVADGKHFTKLVKKDSRSLEDQIVTADIVETYVPLMKDGKFIGAFELYYDITGRNAALNRIVMHSSVTPLVLMFFFLVAIVFIIARSVRERSTAAFNRNSLIYRSPHFSMLVITIATIIFDTIAMVFVHPIPNLSDMEKIILDGIILVMLLSPTIYFFLVQPLMKYNAELSLAEVSLKENRDLLVQEHETLNKVFSQVENAKLEWEKTVDCVSDIIIRTDREGRITRFNKALKDITGKDYNEIIGCYWEDFINDYELELTTLFDTSTEFYHKPTDKWYMLSSYPFYDRELHYSGNVITIHDNTEIKKIASRLEETNSEIKKNRDKLKTALDEVSILIKNVTTNNKLETKYAELKIRPCYEIMNCKKTDCICHGKGTTRCWQIAGTFCRDKIQGQFAQKYGDCSVCEVFKEATSDPISMISEQFNNMMNVLKSKNQQLENAYQDLKKSQSTILQQEKMASIGQLAAGVAHEINNPMGFISSNIRTLNKYVSKLVEYINAQEEAWESLESAEISEQLKEIKKKLKVDYVLEDFEQLIEESLDGADRVKTIVQNLKSFSRVDQAECKPADINECIESTLNIVWNELKYKATVNKEYGDIPLTRCYPQQLNQVFMNLLVNGAQAIEDQGEITIKTWNGDGFVNISISDTGSGIPEEKLNKIFDPFFTTKPVGKGTGLGLSIAYDIIKKHNGMITVESKVGKGTTFNIKIPVVEENAELSSSGESTEPAVSGT